MTITVVIVDVVSTSITGAAQGSCPGLGSAARSSRYGRGVGRVVRPGAAVGGVGQGVGGRGPRANRVAELRVVEVLALGVELEEGVGVVGRVRLRRRFEKVVRLRIHCEKLKTTRRYTELKNSNSRWN